MTRNMKTLMIILLVILAAGGALFAAGGGGGSFWSTQTTRFPLLGDLGVSNNSQGLLMVGGYGFGIDHRGQINGGFGYGIYDPENEDGISGGFGGFIHGYQLLSDPLHLAVVSYTGFGGIGWTSWDGREEASFFALSEEITLEAGLNLGGWFLPTVYVGYQWIVSVIPGEIFTSYQSFAPTMGFRLGFGNV